MAATSVYRVSDVRVPWSLGMGVGQLSVSRGSDGRVPWSLGMDVIREPLRETGRGPGGHYPWETGRDPGGHLLETVSEGPLLETGSEVPLLETVTAARNTMTVP